MITQSMFPLKHDEKEIQKNILKILKIKKCFAIRFNSGAIKLGDRYFRAYILPNGKSDGLPDVGFIKNGKLYFIEVKRKGGRLRPNQREVIKELESFGATTLIADDWEMVLDYVNKLT